MDISVVVPFFNSEEYIEGCIRSLLDQSYPDDRYEIIMVDNNSTDRSTGLVAGHPRVRMLKEPQQSPYAARNRAIRSAEGDVIAFTDPDCQAHSQWLAVIARGMRHPGREIVLGKREYVSLSRGLGMLSDYESAMAAYVFGSSCKEIYFGYTNNMAVRSSLFDELGSFRVLGRGADTLFVRRTVEAFGCGAVGYAPEMIVRHLEVASVLSFYRKRIIYGRSNEENRRFGSARPLSQKERLRVFGYAIRDRRYSGTTACLLLGFLSLGLLFYQYGRLQAR